jgi:hypothetical protein
VVISSTAILCTTPAHAAGSVTVSVTDSGGTGSLGAGYTYTTYTPPPPTVTSVIPSFGPMAGGTPVSVIGTNFLSGATVNFGGAPATSVVVVSSTQLTCVTPANAAGAVTVSVTDTYGTGSLPNGYTYMSGGGGVGTPVGFTPLYPPIKKQPLGLWELDAKRADSLTASGIKKTVFERYDTVTTLTFAWAALSDMPAWKNFMAYALTGGTFTYRPLPNYPNLVSSNPMFQYPGTDNGDNATGFSVVQMVSEDWRPKFESVGTFSFAMELRLVKDM